MFIYGYHMCHSVDEVAVAVTALPIKLIPSYAFVLLSGYIVFSRTDSTDFYHTLFRHNFLYSVGFFLSPIPPWKCENMISVTLKTPC